MHTRSQLFIQTRHPQEVSDFFHVFNTSNILNLVYWKEYFDRLCCINRCAASRRLAA